MQVSLWSEFTDSEIILHVSLYLCECVPCAPTHLPLMVNGNDFRGQSGSLEWGWVCVRGWRPFKLHTELLLRAAWLLAAVPASAQARLAATAVWAGHETVTQLWVTARHVCHRAKCDAFTDFRNKRLINRLKVRLKHGEFYKTHLRVMNHMYNMFNRLSYATEPPHWVISFRSGAEFKEYYLSHDTWMQHEAGWYYKTSHWRRSVWHWRRWTEPVRSPPDFR